MIRTVLVDDDPDVKQLAWLAAQQVGIGLVMFPNGGEALQYLQRHQADVVLLDLMLSAIDGLTIAEEIRRNEAVKLIEPPITIAFLTAANITDAILRVASRVHVRKIFNKPCDYVEMFAEVKGWFHQEVSA